MWIDALFQTVLNMSLTASLVIFFVLCARVLLKKAPKVFSYALWAVVLFRLLCPVSLASGFSLLGVMDLSVTDSGRIAYIPSAVEFAGISTETLPESSIIQSVGAAFPKGDEAASVDAIQIYTFIAAVIWLCGVLLLIAYSMLQYVKLHRRLAGAVLLNKNIYLADYIGSAFVLGLFHPVIYLPSALDKKEQEYITQHERCHIRRGDHVVKLFAFAALCIHWFNPLVWAAFVLSGKDMEMSCDEAVMKEMGSDIRSDYAESLLRLSAGHKGVSAPLAFGEGDVRSRIKNVLSYKKPAVWLTVPAVIALTALAAALVSNPVREPAAVAPQDTVELTDMKSAGNGKQPDNADAVSLERESADEKEESAAEETAFLTMDRIIEMCDSDTWKEEVQNQGLSMFTQYSNVVENDRSEQGESLTGLYRCVLSYNDRNYELQIYYWLPETAVEYGYEENEIDSIGLVERATGDGQLLYITPKEERFVADKDIPAFLSKKYGLEQYISYTLPEGERLGAYKADIDIAGPFEGCLFGGKVTEIHGDFIPAAWNAPGGLGICVGEGINYTFSDGKIIAVEGIQGNHMELLTDGESYDTSDFSVFMVKIQFDLFTASEREEYETANNVELSYQESTSRYWYAYMGREGEAQKYVAFLNADKYSEADMLRFVSSIRPVNQGNRLRHVSRAGFQTNSRDTNC